MCSYSTKKISYDKVPPEILKRAERAEKSKEYVVLTASTTSSGDIHRALLEKIEQAVEQGRLEHMVV